MTDLNKSAREFADETSKLLNSTLTDGISSVVRRDRSVMLGLGVNKRKLVPDLIPLAQNSDRAKLYLFLAHTLNLDAEQEYLTAFSTTYSVQVGNDDESQVLCSYDFVREPPNDFPSAHMHVYPTGTELHPLFEALGTPKRKLDDLHLPVGGKRFRPCLEDVIEFLILDRLVEPRPGWEKAIEAGRERWLKRQLGAAVRRYPEIAEAALNDVDKG